jgi:hypothetical protein
MTLLPITIIGIVVLAIFFLGAVAFWIIFGIKKFQWSMITAIALSAVLLIGAGTFGLRAATSDRLVGKKLHDRAAWNESLQDSEECGTFKKRGIFKIKRSLFNKGPFSKNHDHRFLESERFGRFKNRLENVDSINIKADITIEFNE